jgi:hypothetical protein
MEIMKNPNEICKIKGFNGEQLQYEEVLLRAVSLMKNIINEFWGMEGDKGKSQNNQFVF